MAGRPPGSEVSIYYDSIVYRLEPGDYLRTPAGKLYEVLDVRVQERGIHAGRQHLRCLVITIDQVADVQRVFPVHWYPRKAKTKTAAKRATQATGAS